MNLIEKLGGYEKAADIVAYAPENANYVEIYPLGPRFYITDIGCNRAINIASLKTELLEYCRQNSIFKSGDRIICVNAEGQRYLKEGREYKVKKIDGHKLYVVGYQRFSFLANRFKHVGAKQ